MDIIRPLAATMVDLVALLASAPWTAMKCKLCKTDFTPTPATVVADFTPGQADFDGYAAQTLTFGAPYIDGAGVVRANALVNFVATDGVVPNILYTVYITNTAGTVLEFSARLDGAPISIAATGDGVSLVVSVGLSDGSITVIV